MLNCSKTWQPKKTLMQGHSQDYLQLPRIAHGEDNSVLNSRLAWFREKQHKALFIWGALRFERKGARRGRRITLIVSKRKWAPSNTNTSPPALPLWLKWVMGTSEAETKWGWMKLGQSDWQVAPNEINQGKKKKIKPCYVKTHNAFPTKCVQPEEDKRDTTLLLSQACFLTGRKPTECRLFFLICTSVFSYETPVINL